MKTLSFREKINPLMSRKCMGQKGERASQVKAEVEYSAGRTT